MKTLVVDDQALVLEGLRSFLEANGFAVVGTARNGAEALIKFEMLKPELVLMDIQMVGLDGIQATQMIKKDYPDAKIVMLTAIEDDDSLVAAIQAGAEGYLLKDMDPEDFIRQLTALASGEMPFAPGLARRLMRKLSCQGKKDQTSLNREQMELTERQMALLQLLTQGLTYKEIGAQLGMKVATVRYHINEILAKTRLNNRGQLIAHVSRLGLNGQNADQ
ncbi:response regulator transcription factor [Sporomusa malonica]|uniref:Two component transcriptional regulator, LuxR family n=1 Tax=Sporomusa malonica TaxID=112901 RepID=A0A1W2F455_9FIRM|nr:response regulator transcription factor [Sporomusa malonica]SMD16276.1 two component transcriptional regulator, LuxR family [Sporomusa malonica]